MLCMKCQVAFKNMIDLEHWLTCTSAAQAFQIWPFSRKCQDHSQLHERNSVSLFSVPRRSHCYYTCWNLQGTWRFFSQDWGGKHRSFRLEAEGTRTVHYSFSRLWKGAATLHGLLDPLSSCDFAFTLWTPIPLGVRASAFVPPLKIEI